MDDSEQYNYDRHQQIYCLSAAANAVGSKLGINLQKKMEIALAKTIPSLNGG